MVDLPSEIITSVYKQMDKPSSIAALSSTCHRYHIIWRSKAAFISRAAIYDNIPSFSLALESIPENHISGKCADMETTFGFILDLGYACHQCGVRR